MVKNVLNVHFDRMERTSDSLCIAQKVNGVYNVIKVCASMMPENLSQRHLSMHNTFVFESEYQVYLTEDQYEKGMMINAMSRTKDIRPGQSIRCGHGGLENPVNASSGDLDDSKKSDSFVVLGLQDGTRVAVKAKSGDRWSTIFVDPERHMPGANVTITPKNEYPIYWDNFCQGECIWQKNENDGFHFSMPKEDGATVNIRFGFAKPNQPEGGDDQPRFHID